MVKSKEGRSAELAVTGHVSNPNEWNYSFGQIKRLHILLWSLTFFFLTLKTNWSQCFFLLSKLKKKKKSHNRGVAMCPELNQNPMLLNLNSLFWILENEFSNLKSKKFSRIREEVEYFLFNYVGVLAHRQLKQWSCAQPFQQVFCFVKPSWGSDREKEFSEQHFSKLSDPIWTLEVQ